MLNVQQSVVVIVLMQAVWWLDALVNYEAARMIELIAR